MSLSEQVKALKIHLERAVEAANLILELIYIESESDEEELSTSTDYASTEEIECYIPPAPALVRSHGTYFNERPGTPSMIQVPPPLPEKAYKKIEVDRFDK